MSNRDPKEIILDAALATFVAHGFERATTGQITARAGVSNGALFHHFPTKDAIAEALYLRGIASYQTGLVQALARHRGAKVVHAKAARATVRAAVHHHLAWVEQNRDLAWFMYERGRPDWQPAHGAAVRELNRATAEHVRDWMAPLAHAGVIRDLPLTVLAALVNGPAHFVARRWLSGSLSARPTSFADVLADAAWAAIAPHRPRAGAPSPRLSPAALIEATALDAARAASEVAATGDWTILRLAMSDVSTSTPSRAEGAKVRSVRSEGRIAVIEVDLLDAGGGTTARGDVVCVWRDDPTTPHGDDQQQGDGP
ncbi:MAG TPA: TetR/AcrR family transcriptional regulator [Xanthobacteraceae bacterium]|nr:TetR/AcrR family transcriptional regulator [Xanthobacteraceae bacterium]